MTTQMDHQRIEQIITLTERLTALIEQQAQAFEGRPQDASLSMPETSRLAAIYQQEAQRMRADPGVLATLPGPQKARLAQATEAFDAVVARQARTLAAAKSITEGLMRTLAEAVAVRRAGGYGPNGSTSTGSGATPLAVNQHA